MVTEKDVEQYLDRPVRVKLTNGRTFDGTYWDWQLDVSDDVPDAMILAPLDGRDLGGGHVLIEASRIVGVEPL